MMADKKGVPPRDRPEIKEDQHRPVGVPRPREIKSQKAQLESELKHGTNKALKLGMVKKSGLGED